MKSILVLTILLIALASCGKEQSESSDKSSSTLSSQEVSLLKTFYGTMTEFKVEVFYEEGSSPYTGSTVLGKDYWNLFSVNIKKVLQTSERAIAVDIPTKTSAMSSFPKKNKASWDVSDARELFQEVGAQSQTPTKAVVSIAFVSGYFKNSNGEIKDNVLGVHITGTTQIVIFKDLIKNIEESENSWVALYSEQAVLTHEVGHAIGMVNNGLSMSTDHQDSEHGKHCTNEDCVMYWLNEGRDGLKSFIQQYISSGSEIIFGEQCLEDASKLIQTYR